MTCFANNEGVERLLRDILIEVQKISRESAPPTPPTPLPPSAAKHSVAGLPSKFLAIMGNGTQWKYFKTHKGWDAFRCNKDGDFVFDDNVDDTSARITFDEAREVWLRYK